MKLPQQLSLVAQTVAILREEIGAGVWTKSLPGEAELCKKLRVSRLTLRAALAEMPQAGPVRSSQGKRREDVARHKRTLATDNRQVSALLLPSGPKSRCAKREPAKLTIIKFLFVISILALAASTFAAGKPQFSDVFVSGKDGFPSIRIPSVVVAKNGTVLAIAEGRAAAADQAHNKIILRRSTDGGKTWGPLQIIADDGMNSLNNPCTVVDEKTGRVIVMFQEYPANHHEHDGTIKPGLTGPDIVRNYVVTSDDNGATWSKLKDVTRTTKYAQRVTTVASGPGIGIQLTRGAHAGRIIIPFNEGPFGLWKVLTVYSDDGGQHWHLGEPAPGCCVTNAAGKITSLVNEVQMAELSDGSVMLNSRHWGGAPVRKIAISHDGGETWSKIEEDPALPGPGCTAAFYRYSFAGKGKKNCLLFSNPDSNRRANGTIRASFNDGKTWPVKRVLWPGSFAYSSLTRLPDGEIGCLFEADNYKRIVFARFSLAWVEATVATPP